MERSILILRHFLYFSVQLGCGGLIHTAGLFQTALTDGFQYAEDSGSIYIGRIFRRVETYLYMALGREIVYFIGTHTSYHLNQAHRVGHVGIMQMKMRASFQVGDPFAEIH